MKRTPGPMIPRPHAEVFARCGNFLKGESRMRFRTSLLAMALFALNMPGVSMDFFLETDYGVFDTETGLHWWIGPDRNTSRSEAEDLVAGLDGDWRMPGVEELRHLHTSGVTTGNWGPFANSGSRVWCTAPDEESTESWYFYFDRGSEDWRLGDLSVNARVFAVLPAEEDQAQ